MKCEYDICNKLEQLFKTYKKRLQLFQRLRSHLDYGLQLFFRNNEISLISFEKLVQIIRTILEIPHKVISCFNQP